MQIDGQVSLNIDPATVWARISSPQTMVQVIPHCRTVTGDPETGYEITVGKRFGLINFSLKVDLAVVNAAPPDSWRLEASAQNRLIGAVTAFADIAVTPESSGSRLTYSAGANVPERLTKLAGDGLEQLVRRKIDEFFIQLETVS